MSQGLSEVGTELRIGEVAVELPSQTDAGIFSRHDMHAVAHAPRLPQARHQAWRDLLLQTPFGSETTGTFVLRSPVRPNPIASSIVKLVSVESTTFQVRGLDCVDGTPLLDLKPDYPPASSKDHHLEIQGFRRISAADRP
jgi:tRNA (Thr-GGU) A37 N-methylase